MARRRLKKKIKYGLIVFVILLVLAISIPLIKKYSKDNKSNAHSNFSNKVKTSSSTLIDITMVGDLLFESPFYKAIDNGYNKDEYFSSVKHYFSDDDLSLANMEVVIGNNDMQVSGDGYNFCAPTYVGDLVSSLDLEVLSTANNHAYDREINGVNSTLDYFSKTDIKTIGTYRSYEDRNNLDSKILKIKGINFGFLAYTFGTNKSIPQEYKDLIGIYRNTETKKFDDQDKQLLEKEVKALREKVDVLVVMMHWGQEFTFRPSSEQKEVANFLSNLGVDIIYGSHSHSIQDVEVIGNKTLVFYSLGNFTSHDDDIARTPSGNETFDNAYQFGLIGKVKLRIDKNKTVNFKNIKTEVVVNYFDKDMSNFKLIPLKDYNDSYEKSHYRYNLGLNKEFINKTYNNAVNEMYRTN